MLVLQRPSDSLYFPNKWNLPGGKLKPYQSIISLLELIFYESYHLNIEVTNDTPYVFSRPIVEGGKYDGYYYMELIYTSMLLLNDTNIKYNGKYEWINLAAVEQRDLVYESYNALVKYKNKHEIDKHEDGMISLPKILITNRILISNSRGRFLIVKRTETDSYEPGRWELPGGKMDEFESLDEHLQREVFEETGLIVKIVNSTESSLSEIIKDGKYKGYTHITLLSTATTNADNVKLSLEHDDFKWIEREELLEMELSRTSKRIVADYLQR